MATGGKRGKASAPGGLEELRRDVAGCDLGATEHWVCGPPTAQKPETIERFGTTTPEVERMCQWLAAHGVGSVAMESTGVYWIPVYEMLELAGFQVVLVNARQLRNVPGRPKTDRLDCQWIRRLHSCGLLRGSFRPPATICTLRALNRQKENFAAQRKQTVQWMQKALDQMNVQVPRAVTDITGMTGMAIVKAIVAGERDPKILATLRDHRCKKSAAQIAAHLTGTWGEEHVFNLQMAVAQYEQLTGVIEHYERKIQRGLHEHARPELTAQCAPAHPKATKYRAMSRRGELEHRERLYRFGGCDLTRIDGISTGVATTVLLEVGPDLSAFPSEQQFCAWIGRVPLPSITGGKPTGKKTKRAMAATRIATALSQAASSLKHSPTALGASFRRLCRRKDYKVAVFATARKLATLIYRMLRYGQDYIDQGADAYESHQAFRRINHLALRARELGYKLIPLAPDTPRTGVVSG